jgi:exodeoxyribonuclease V alpha subunit
LEQIVSQTEIAQDTLRLSLLQRVKGIGEDRARRLLDAYGESLPDALSRDNNIEEIAAVLAPEKPMLSRQLAAILSAHWKESLAPEFKAMAWLDQHRISEKGLARRIVRILGANTAQTLDANPYVLSKTLKWPKMDSVGRRVLRSRLPIEAVLRAPQRLLGALDNAIGEWMASGHTAIPKPTLEDQLGLRINADIKTAVALGVEHGRLVDAGNSWRFRGCAHLEKEIACRLRAMATEPGAISIGQANVDRAITETMAKLSAPLSDEQKQAVRHALLHPFSVIAGGAGTGKTATMQALVLAWEALGGKVHLCALAGKAALRLSQATHRLARTIHRTLTELALRDEAQAMGDEPHSSWSQLNSATLLIVDESSMVDLGQWARLLKAMPSGCRLVMVGDTAQLPPIGFGLVFHLLAQKPETAVLTRIFRQNEASGIPIIANEIRQKKVPNLKAFDGIGDGAFFESCASTEMGDHITSVVDALGGFGNDGLALHVVAATNSCVTALNRRFHDARRQEKDEVKGYLEALFSVGDPVVHLENDYRRALFNGMLGTVQSVDTIKRSVEVSFDGAIHLFEREAMSHINLAYAITCHKLQGSQAKRVVIALEQTSLVEPSWLYTAITRAERQVVIVGSDRMLEQAIQREFAWKVRCVGGLDTP